VTIEVLLEIIWLSFSITSGGRQPPNNAHHRVAASNDSISTTHRPQLRCMCLLCRILCLWQEEIIDFALDY
jgi:hypothetical protein